PIAINIEGNKVWHTGNDGSGSGLDADKLDGAHKDTDATLSGNSDSSIPTEKAVKTYVDSKIMTFTNNKSVSLQWNDDEEDPNCLFMFISKRNASDIDFTINNGYYHGQSLYIKVNDEHRQISFRNVNDSSINDGYHHLVFDAVESIWRVVSSY
ncbi:MAG: hypothetical protein MJA31_16995, partial [Clostridia bacterium]|nr:hypothetical protein [Clostridia bacterium]